MMKGKDAPEDGKAMAIPGKGGKAIPRKMMKGKDGKAMPRMMKGKDGKAMAIPGKGGKAIPKATL